MTPETTSPASAAPTVGEPTGQSVVLFRLVALGLLVAGLVNIAGLAGVPQNAPVEQVYAFGISLSLVVTAVVLFFVSVATGHRPPGLSARGEKLSALTILAVVFGVVTVGGALAMGGAEQLWLFVQGARLRYMYENAGVFFFGVPWALGIAFGAVSFRRGGGRLNTVLAVVALVLGLLIVIPSVTATVIYGLGLSD